MEPVARRFEQFVEDHLLDGAGLVYSFLRADTLRPWTNRELQEAGYDYRIVYRFERGRADEVMAYEDTLMATAEYGLSQMERFHATGEAGALASAAYEVGALLRVLHEGEHHEKGYLPKPHGGLQRAAYSHEISPDQYSKTIVTLRAWQPLAPPAQKRTIDEYLVAIADYFINRNFIHQYRDRTLVSAPTHPHALSFYIPILVVAGNITGRAHYREQLKQFDPVLDNLAKGGGIHPSPNGCALYTDGLHLAMQEGLDDPRLAVIIQHQWEACQPFLTGDGQIWDAARTFTSARSVRMISAAPLVDQYHSSLEAWKTALALMQLNQDPRAIRHVTADHGIPAGLRFQMNAICETSLSSWLLGYWRLRQQWKP